MNSLKQFVNNSYNYYLWTPHITVSTCGQYGKSLHERFCSFSSEIKNLLYDFSFSEYLNSPCFRCSVIARPLLWVECEMFCTGWISEYLIPSGWYAFVRLKTGLAWQVQVSRQENIHRCSRLPSTRWIKCGKLPQSQAELPQQPCRP